jgi:hypothetical protein
VGKRKTYTQSVEVAAAAAGAGQIGYHPCCRICYPLAAAEVAAEVVAAVAAVDCQTRQSRWTLCHFEQADQKSMVWQLCSNLKGRSQYCIVLIICTL